MEFFHKKTSFPFMATRKVWYALSIVLMIVSFISFFSRGLNFAIDFTGGISVEANFPRQVNIDQVRRAFIAGGRSPVCAPGLASAFLPWSRIFAQRFRPAPAIK